MMFLCVPVLLPKKNKLCTFCCFFSKGAASDVQARDYRKSEILTIEKARFSATGNARPANGNSPHP